MRDASSKHVLMAMLGCQAHDRCMFFSEIINALWITLQKGTHTENITVAKAPGLVSICTMDCAVSISKVLIEINQMLVLPNQVVLRFVTHHLSKNGHVF